MPKEVKKSYDYLDLNYNSTPDEVDLKYNQIFEKISKKQLKNTPKYEKSIKKLHFHYNLIKNYINEFGVSKENRTNISAGEILTQTFVLVLIVYILIRLIVNLT